MTLAAGDTPAPLETTRWDGPDELRPLLVPIDTLTPLPGNPRRGDVEAVARSLARFGQRKNITRRPEGITTAGNHTRLAALSLGWTHLAVVTIDETDAEAKAWALADNRSSDLATNDDADLAAMLAEIQAADADLLAAASYADEDLDALLAGLAAHTGVYGFDDSGGASRFFTQTTWGSDDAGMPVMVYVPKPSTAERNAGLDGLPERVINDTLTEGDAGLNSPRAGAGRTGAQANFHPTVKPVALMRWLVRLVTPPLGTVLEPFTGSGKTLVAAVLEGFDAIGVELTADYVPIIEARDAWAQARCADVVGTPEA